MLMRRVEHYFRNTSRSLDPMTIAKRCSLCMISYFFGTSCDLAAASRGHLTMVWLKICGHKRKPRGHFPRHRKRSVVGLAHFQSLRIPMPHIDAPGAHLKFPV